MKDTWNANVYSEFLDLRTKPAEDLLNAIPSSFVPKIIYDLGCGPGNSTFLLKERFKDANITGIDSSANMVKMATAKYPDLHFRQMTIEEYSLAVNLLGKVDLLFANASLQWVSHHEVLFPKLTAMLNPGGIIAIQMPNNFHAPTHQLIIRLLSKDQIWQPFLKKLIYGELTKPLYDPVSYYNILIKAGCEEVSSWETEYF